MGKPLEGQDQGATLDLPNCRPVLELNILGSLEN